MHAFILALLLPAAIPDQPLIAPHPQQTPAPLEACSSCGEKKKKKKKKH